MTDAKPKTREQELADQFKEGLDTKGAVALQQRVDELEERVKTVEGERDAAKTKAAEDVKRVKANVSQGPKSKSPRKLGEMDDGMSGQDLKDAIADAKSIEIVFSDGTREITAANPVSIEGDAWRDHSQGLMLKEPVELHGPAPGNAGFQVDGYALLIDGKQVAYRKRSDPINVGPGQRLSLSDDIFF